MFPVLTNFHRIVYALPEEGAGLSANVRIWVQLEKYPRDREIPKWVIRFLEIPGKLPREVFLMVLEVCFRAV
jgi:hypothetical protein